MTLAGAPYESLLPWSVSFTLPGTLTVDEGDGEAEPDDELLASFLPELQPVSAKAKTAAVATRARGMRVRGGRTRSLCRSRRHHTGRPRNPRPCRGRGQQPSSRSAK